MQKQTDLNAIPDTITTDKWKEEKSRTDLKAITEQILIAPHDLDEEDPNYDEVECQCNSLIQWQINLLNLAITYACSFNRWKTIINVMLLNEPGNFKIHHLEVIHLYKHVYNLLLAIKWWHMIHHCT